MKKRFFSLLGGLLCTGLLLSCAKKENQQNVLTVAASPEPHKAILELVVADLAKENITLKITEFTDYVTPNDAVETGEQDANFFQHVPYMESFNKEHGYHLASVGAVHIEPLALYSQKYTSLSELKSGDMIAIPNDPTNEARALLLLAAQNIITLRADAGLAATPQDITENPLKLVFREKPLHYPASLPMLRRRLLTATMPFLQAFPPRRTGSLLKERIRRMRMLSPLNRATKTIPVFRRC